MIKQQIFALEMDALTNRLQRLQLDNKIVTLLREPWDDMKNGGLDVAKLKQQLMKMEWKLWLGN